MKSKITIKLKKVWILILILILAIPCFLMGKAFAYWSGLVNPPADKTDSVNSQSGSGKELAVTFNFDNVYTSPAKLVPTGCAQYAYPGTTVSETAIKDYRISWNTTDTTALETKIKIKFINIGLCDSFNNTFYTNYSSNCKVSVSLGDYSSPSNPNSFIGTSVGNYAGNTLGQMEFMVNRETEMILRLQVSITDYSRTNATAYRTFKNAVANSNFRVDFQYTVEDPNLYKTTNIWAQFDTAPVTNQNIGPYYNETSNYIYQANVKIYVEGQSYNAGDVLYVNDPASPHYGQYYLVLQGGTPINIDNPNTNWWDPMTWTESTIEYRSYHHYNRGDFVIHSNRIYFWDSTTRHNPNTWNASGPPGGNWTLYTTDPTLNVWQRHKIYTYGDVVRWWSGTIGAGRPLDRIYVSIMDMNVISATNGTGTGPNPANYSSQWVTVAQFQSRSAAFNATRVYTEGESMLYTDGKYYIAIRDTVAGRTPLNSPDHWKKVSW